LDEMEVYPLLTQYFVNRPHARDSMATMCGGMKNVLRFVCISRVSKAESKSLRHAAPCLSDTEKVVDVGGAPVSKMRSSKSAEAQQLY
jgi:hypothetical protein